jgi:hypothetical protein
MAGAPTITGRYIVKGVNLDKPQSMVKSWGAILRYMSGYKLLFAVGMILVVFESLMAVFAPNYISDMTDWWSRKISEGADAEDKAQFDEFMTSVETQTLIDTISK